MQPDRAKTVFSDPRGGRRRIVQAAVLLGSLLVIGAVGYFIWGLLIAPQLRLPALVRNHHARFRALPPSKLPARDLKDDWRRTPPAFRERGVPATAKSRGGRVVLGHVSPWDPASILSLERHADQLTHVAADWFSLTGVEGTLEEEPVDKVRLLCLRKGVGFLPILRNLDANDWQPEAVEAIATAGSGERNAFLERLAGRMPPGAKGLMIEWSQLDPTYRKETSRLIVEIAGRLHASGKELWFSVPTGNDFDTFDLEVIASAADRMVAALYDENSEAGDPGPIASGDWFEGWLKTMMVYGDPGQWVVGLGNYAYDWRKDNATVEELGFADVMARAVQAGVAPREGVDFNNNAPDFNYLGGPDWNQEHEVWFQDAVTFYNQSRTASPYHPGGLGIYRLGQEDPAVWDVLRMDPAGKPDRKQLSELSRITLDDEIASTGTGDFITVGEDPRPGEREIKLAPGGDLSERYLSFPLPESIFRQGDPGPHRVALTFDDGPDSGWTPKILDILREKKAPAAFFVLGSQAQRYPDLLERIAREGHELGNHSYTHRNLTESGDQEIELELNATTRLIEAVTGRSTAYFRPPYNRDGTPTQPGEIRALRVARDLGYLTVGQSIDPDDWERPGMEALIRRVKHQRPSGSIILLHDSGGDRSQTVAALPAIIDYLRARGDEIVPLSEIIRLPRDTVMPPLHEEEQPLSARYVYGGFTVLRFLENAAWTLLAVVTLLALLRVIFLSVCAWRHRRGECAAITGGDAGSRHFPPVSVLLAAYNEERVIASTIEHLLGADYPSAIEILVVDDGSTDRTAAMVEGIAAGEPRVRFFTQPNGGKASALNRAFAESRHGTLVMIDADTMVAKDGLRRVVAPLADPAVGAVSGHIRVGNTRGWLGRFQDLEYACAFEIDRRAQDFLGCITVAPGALSSFRREALEEAGPLTTDTLAEDTDLTLQLHRLGWKVVFAPQALADTEAPESVRALLSQRFRWAFGTLQCLWKHGDIVFSSGSGWLGWFALPSVWVFQIAVVAVTPILDIIVFWSLWLGRGVAIWPYFVASLLLDFVLAIVALRLGGRPLRSSWLTAPMRLLYRPLLGYVVWKCLLKATAGSWVHWAKLDRTAAAIRQKNTTPAATQ